MNLVQLVLFGIGEWVDGNFESIYREKTVYSNTQDSGIHLLSGKGHFLLKYISNPIIELSPGKKDPPITKN